MRGRIVADLPSSHKSPQHLTFALSSGLVSSVQQFQFYPETYLRHWNNSHHQNYAFFDDFYSLGNITSKNKIRNIENSIRNIRQVITN
jgi:hypothetical protein